MVACTPAPLPISASLFAPRDDLPYLRRPKMNMTRFTLSLTITVLMAISASAQNVVVQWNAIASTTIVTNA
jgi:hypothetical protein